MALKSYTVEQEINGVKYKAQFNGLSAALKANDSTYIEGTSVTSLEKMAEYILKHVIIEPRKLTVDDFDDMDELGEVVAFGREVMHGSHNPDKKTEKEVAEK